MMVNCENINVCKFPVRVIYPAWGIALGGNSTPKGVKLGGIRTHGHPCKHPHTRNRNLAPGTEISRLGFVIKTGRKITNRKQFTFANVFGSNQTNELAVEKPSFTKSRLMDIQAKTTASILPSGVCPKENRVSFRTKERAEMMMARATRKEATPKERTTYQCDHCGRWHFKEVKVEKPPKPRVPTPKCPDTGKLSYDTAMVANYMAQRVGQTHQRPMRAYKCRHCGQFHLTSKIYKKEFDNIVEAVYARIGVGVNEVVVSFTPNWIFFRLQTGGGGTVHERRGIEAGAYTHGIERVVDAFCECIPANRRGPARQSIMETVSELLGR